MKPGHSWPLAGAVLFLGSAACVVGFVLAPVPVLAVAAVILVIAVVMRRRLGTWRVPVLVTSVVAILLAGGMLLLSVDFGIDDCPDGRCEVETPVPLVPIEE